MVVVFVRRDITDHITIFEPQRAPEAERLPLIAVLVMAVDRPFLSVGQGFGGLVEFIESVECIEVLWNWMSPDSWDQDRL